MGSIYMNDSSLDAGKTSPVNFWNTSELFYCETQLQFLYFDYTYQKFTYNTFRF